MKPYQPTEEELQYMVDTFEYREGKLYYYVLSGTRKNPAGWLHSDNRYALTIQRRSYLRSRVTYFLCHGVWPGQFFVDHIDGDCSNDKIENLRLLTNIQNARASKKPMGAIGWRGVTKHSKNTVRASLSWEKSSIKSPSFVCPREAALWWNHQAEKHGYLPEAFNQVFEDNYNGND